MAAAKNKSGIWFIIAPILIISTIVYIDKYDKDAEKEEPSFFPQDVFNILQAGNINNISKTLTDMGFEGSYQNYDNMHGGIHAKYEFKREIIDPENPNFALKFHHIISIWSDTLNMIECTLGGESHAKFMYKLREGDFAPIPIEQRHKLYKEYEHFLVGNNVIISDTKYYRIIGMTKERLLASQ